MYLRFRGLRIGGVRRTTRSACAIFLSSILVFSNWIGCSSGEGDLPNPSAVVERRPIERIVMATGTIEPEGEVAVRSRIAGIIEEIAVEAGDMVNEGDVLLEIERELIVARLNEARAGVNAAKVEVRFAEIALRRVGELQLKGASSDSKHDDARAAYESALARMASAEAAIATLSVQLRHATVRAPMSGRVLDVLVKVGGAVSPVTSVTGGTVLLSMAETSQLHLKGSVDENEIARIAIDQLARIRTEAYRDRTFEGRVREIAPVGNRVQNITYFEVEIEITDPDALLLKPRMSGDAEIIAERIPEAIVVPETALRYEGDTIYVDVFTNAEASGSESDFERHDVVVGVVDGDWVEILEGLAVDDRVSLQ